MEETSHPGTRPKSSSTGNSVEQEPKPDTSTEEVKKGRFTIKKKNVDGKDRKVPEESKAPDPDTPRLAASRGDAIDGEPKEEIKGYRFDSPSNLFFQSSRDDVVF